MDPITKYLNTQEAAERMGVPIDLVRSLCNEGLLPGAKQKHANGPWRIPVGLTVLKPGIVALSGGMRL
jgi:hypothetical protein